MYKRQLQGSQPVRASTPVPVVEESVVSAVNTSSYREVEPVRTGSGAATYNHLPNTLAHIIQQLPVVDGLEAVSYTHLDVYKRQN